MPAVTDLTFQQLNDSLKKITGSTTDLIQVDPDGGMLTLQLTPLTNNSRGSTASGVIKALSMLLDAARDAQETANTGKTTGERLAAFPTPTTGTPANGQVPITRSLAARALLSSATQIVGTNV